MGDTYVTTIGDMDVTLSSSGSYWVAYQDVWGSALAAHSDKPLDSSHYEVKVPQEIIDFCKAHRALSIMKPKFYDHTKDGVADVFIGTIDGADLWWRKSFDEPTYSLENRLGIGDEEMGYPAAMYYRKSIASYNGGVWSFTHDFTFTEPMQQFIMAHSALVS